MENYYTTLGMGVILFCIVLVSLFISTGFCCAQQLEQLDQDNDDDDLFGISN